MRATPRRTHRTVTGVDRPSLQGVTAAVKHAGSSQPHLDTDQMHRARLTVCHMATDADDARNLMAMLGLAPAPAEGTPR